MSTPISPIDEVHAQCIELRRLLNGLFAAAKERAGEWDIRPCPSKEEFQ